jgi:hypothetical protein
MPRPSLWIALVSLMLAACGSEAEELLVDAPPPPPGGMQLVSPRFTVPAASERFMCMEIPFDTDREIFVRQSTVHQSPGGHHMLVFFVQDGDDAGGAGSISTPRECRGEDMGSGGLRILGAGSSAGSGIALPPGVAFRVPPGVRVVSQSHYLNLTSEPIEVQDAINLELVPADEVASLAGAFAQVDLGLELPAREITTREMSCQLPLDGMRVPWLLPHMHEFGSHKRVELRRDGQDPLILWEGDWEESLRDHFPIVDLDDMEMNRSDVLHTECTWDNTTDGPMLFPTEMCATFMVFHPSDEGALHVCDDAGNEFVL